MPKIEVRAANSTDIPILMSIDHGYSSEYTWQMEFFHEENEISIHYRDIRLPRSVRVEYPRSVSSLADTWTKRDGLLVATLDSLPVGYISMMLNIAPLTSWVTDVVVTPQLRRQGVGSVLLLAAQEWARQKQSRRIILEMQTKNHPAMQLAKKNGFDFCGYHDRYYANQDIALFFIKTIN